MVPSSSRVGFPDPSVARSDWQGKYAGLFCLGRPPDRRAGDGLARRRAERPVSLAWARSARLRLQWLAGNRLVSEDGWALGSASKRVEEEVGDGFDWTGSSWLRGVSLEGARRRSR